MQAQTYRFRDLSGDDKVRIQQVRQSLDDLLMAIQCKPSPQGDWCACAVRAAVEVFVKSIEVIRE